MVKMMVLGSGCLMLPPGGFAAPPGTEARREAEPAGREGLTLARALEVALTNNPRLAAAEAGIAAAGGRAWQTKRWSNPQLRLNADEWPVSGGRGFSDAIQTIGVAQLLPYPGKKNLERRIGGAGVRIAEAELALRRTEVARDVKAAFAQVLAAERLIEVSTQLLEVARASAATARKRVEAGDAAYQEQLRAEVQAVQAQSELKSFEREWMAARQTLAAILGLSAQRDLRVSGALAESPREELLGRPVEELLLRHPSARAAQAEVARAELEERRTRLDPYPDVTVEVSGGKIGETDQSIIQLGLAVPLPILDTGKGRRREAQANLRAAEAEQQAVLRELIKAWATAQQRYRTAAEQAADYRDRALPKVDEALRLVRTGFEQGKFNFIDLADTQRTAAEVRRAYQQTLLELNVAQAEVEALAEPVPSASVIESK